MQRIIKQSKALLLLLAFVLVFSPLSALADAGNTKTINYVALGDSLAAGLLSDGKTMGTGYAGYIKSDLGASGYEVILNNKGVNGATSEHVLTRIKGIEKDLKSTDIITISVGANDVLSGLDFSLFEDFNPAYLNPFIVEQLKLEAKNTVLDVLDTTDGLVFEADEMVKSVQATAIGMREAIEGYLTEEITENLFKDFEDAADSVKEAEIELTNARVAFNEAKVKEAVDALELAKSKLEDVTPSLTSSIEIIETNIPEEYLDFVPGFIDQINFTLAKVKDVELVVDVVVAAIETYLEELQEIDRLVKVGQEVTVIFAKIDEVGMNVASILENIKTINPNAKIYVMGYYNALPYLPSVMQENIKMFLGILNDRIMGSTLLAGATFVPTFDLFEGNYGAYLPNPENIHPSDEGYRALANGFMVDIKESFPDLEEPGEKEVDLGGEVNVSAGEKLLINGTQVSLLLPEDLPEGTTLTVTPTSEEALAKAKGLKAVGDVLNFIFEFPEGFDDYEGTFTLVMGYDKVSPDDVAIYYFNEDKDAWESQQGQVNKETYEISLEVTHFSNYGVFVQEDAEDPKDPPATEDPSDDDKTPPVTKDPTKGSDKDSKTGGKKTTTTNSGSKLPKTATNNYALLLLGTILLVSGLASLILMRKKLIITNEI